MGDYTEVFVGIDAANVKNAVAIAEAGRSGLGRLKTRLKRPANW